MMAKSNAGPPPGEDELVPLAEIVRASGWPAFRVRLALGEAGERLLVYPGRGFQGREDRRRKLYPLHYTLALLRAQEGEKRPERPDLEADERVPLERITTDLGWAPNTVKRYLLAARRLVHTFPDPKDNRKKLYPSNTP